MSDFLSKLSSYNLFNYLFPGAIFVTAWKTFGFIEYEEVNIIIDLFIFYFAGMTISRVGSVIIEPIFKGLGIVRYAQYGEYLSAREDDDTIEILLEQNNTYRTIVALFVSFAVALAGDWAVRAFGIAPAVVAYILGFGIFLLYALAYRKQTAYIRQRVQRHSKRNTKSQESGSG